MTAAFVATTARPRRFRRLLLPAGALLLVIGLLGILAGTRSEPSSPESTLAAPSAAASDSGLQGISSLQNRLRTAPRDADSWGALGSLYVDQARVTADPIWYGKAQGALRKSLELKSAANVGALIGLGKLANARHDFAGGLRWGERAGAAAPGRAAPYGVIGDALIELGRYPEAFAAIQRMVDLRPDLDIAHLTYTVRTPLDRRLPLGEPPRRRWLKRLALAAACLAVGYLVARAA